MSAMTTSVMSDGVASLSAGLPAGRGERGMRIAFGLLVAATLGLSAACLTYSVVQSEELAAGYGPSTPASASGLARGHARATLNSADVLLVSAM